MTNREKAIVMAYTGTCMLTGDKFQIFHEYIEDIMGRPVMTHEIGYLENTIKEKAKDDFIALCEEQEPCEDCISRQAVEDAIAETIVNGESLGYAVAYDILYDLPSVTPQPKMGRWIDDKCSVCGKGTEDLISSSEWYRNEEPNFCPFCGLKMVEPQESEVK